MGGHAAAVSGAASQEELVAHKVPLAYRDFCSALLIPLNECRKASYYLPWKCEHERHEYEKCQYLQYKSAVSRMKAIREAQ